jgi:FkbM family methyltransferase
MNGTAFWSWAYEIVSRKETGLAGKMVSKPLAIAMRLIRRFRSDPIVRLRVGGRVLLMPWSHNLPLILRNNPLYEAEIGRLARHLSETDGQLVLVDVGANIGDTIATLPKLDRAKFLCIDGSERYFDLLRQNYAADAQVKVEFALLTDGTDQTSSTRIKEGQGTAHVETAESSGTAAPCLTLDQLLERYPEFKNANFCKVDTDGYDLRVLRGATAFLRQAKPCLHIEVAPQHWRLYGGCEVADGLAFLSSFGYEELLVYDNLGYFIARDRTENPRVLGLLANYAMRRPAWFYYNVIAFHKTRRDLEEFYGREIEDAVASANSLQELILS